MQFDELIQQRHEHPQRSLYIKINCVTSSFFAYEHNVTKEDRRGEQNKKKQWGAALAK